MKMTTKNLWNVADKGNPRYILREKLVPFLLYPSQNLHGLTWHRTWSSSVTGLRLTAFCAVGLGWQYFISSNGYYMQSID